MAKIRACRKLPPDETPYCFFMAYQHVFLTDLMDSLETMDLMETLDLMETMARTNLHKTRVQLCWIHYLFFSPVELVLDNAVCLLHC